MRVISLVPSWTETLLEAGVNVVGRTRYCVHPAPRVSHLPVVGGTKDVDWEKVRELNADLLLLDREENPLWMAEQSPIRWHATHVRDVPSLAQEMREISSLFNSTVLSHWADEAAALTPRSTPPPELWLQRWGEWDSQAPIAYVIWKNPWMVVGPSTYICLLYTSPSPRDRG